MNRKVSDLQSNLFKLLTLRTSIQLESFPRIKVFLSDKDYDSVRRDVTLVVQLRFGRGQIACIYEYVGENYLVLPYEFEEIKIPSLEAAPDLVPIQFIHLITNQIEPTDKASEGLLLEHIFLDPAIEFVHWEDILKYFPSFTMFKISDTLPEDEKEKLNFLKRLCIESVCQNSSLLQLPFDNDTLTSFSSIASSIDNNIPYDNVLRSLLSYHWKFCFIDLYRCQERLLMLAWVDEFKNTMNSSLPINELYNAMKSRYSTEHHEDENMRSLYRLLPQNILDIMTKASSPDTKANYIYKLRNRIVHFQHSDADIETMKDEEWNMIVRFVLESIPYLYNKLQNYIIELPGV